MNTIALVAVLLVLFVAVSAVTFVMFRSGGNGGLESPVEHETQPTTTATWTTTSSTQYTTSSIPTTTTEGASIALSSGASITIWDLYPDVKSIVISPYYDDSLQALVDWPVLLNGSLYAISDIYVSYKIIKSDGFNATMNMSWSLSPNQTFTAACSDVYGSEIISEETFYNVYLVSHTMTWTGGGKFSYTAYPYNASALYWFHTMPPMDTPDQAMWLLGVLGGTTMSPTGTLTWSCAAAKAPQDIGLVERCNPYFREDGDPWAAFNDEIFQGINEEATAFLLSHLSPPELFTRDVLYQLAETTETYSDTFPSTVPDYETVHYTITYLGKVGLPGEGIQVDAWRIDFETEPLLLNGTYILTASIITPLWYKVTLTDANGSTITIEYTLESLHILYEWSLPLEEYISVP